MKSRTWRESGYNVCDECNDNNKPCIIHHVMGDGCCDKHGRFAFYYRVEKLCKQCATEEGICQICGKKII